MKIVAVKCTALGHRVGESNQNARHSDKLVDEVRALHLTHGMGVNDIVVRLGIARRTVRDWVTGKRRSQQWLKIKMVRVYD